MKCVCISFTITKILKFQRKLHELVQKNGNQYTNKQQNDKTSLLTSPGTRPLDLLWLIAGAPGVHHRRRPQDMTKITKLSLNWPVDYAVRKDWESEGMTRSFLPSGMMYITIQEPPGSQKMSKDIWRHRPTTPVAMQYSFHTKSMVTTLQIKATGWQIRPFPWVAYTLVQKTLPTPEYW